MSMFETAMFFDAMENLCKSAHANAADRLGERGEIVRVELGRFPWCPYRLRNEEKPGKKN